MKKAKQKSSKKKTTKSKITKSKTAKQKKATQRTSKAKASNLKTIKQKLPKKFDAKHFRIAIFGSARSKPSHPSYKKIHALAKEIGKLNLDIVTGGGPGLMEAANKGHKAGFKEYHKQATKNFTKKKSPKSKGIGLLIQLPKEQRSNAHLDISKDFKYFSNRLNDFMALSNAVVVAPGGIGTILELYYTWQLLQVEHICKIPIILHGKMWKELLAWMQKWQLNKGFIDKADLDLVYIVKNNSEAIEVIKNAHLDWKSGKNVCKNFKKYKVTR